MNKEKILRKKLKKLEKVGISMNEKHILIYGLDDERSDYYNNLIGENQKSKYIPLFIEDYNNKLASILLQEWGKKRNRYTVQPSAWDSEKSFSKFIKEISRSTEIIKKYPFWEMYLFTFQSQHFLSTLEIIYNRPLKMFQKKDCHDVHIDIDSHVEVGRRIGFEMAQIHDDLIVHFVLDNIDFKEVLSKNMDGYDYTSKEFRYVYRNWEKLKEKIIFIENNERVIAPWEKDPELWKNYQPKKKQELSNLEPEKKQTELSDLEHEKKNQELNGAEPEKKDHKRSELEQKKKMQDLNNPQLEKNAHFEITKTSQTINDEQTKNKHSLIKRMGNGIWKRIKNVFSHSNKKSVDLHKNLPNIENGKTSTVVALSYHQYPLPQTSRFSESKLKHDIKLSQITSKGLNESKTRNEKATHSLMIR
ncbi:hypothetical protein ACTNBL_11190 [Enterococcus villorum]|uniref:hypothetical protein n=1 Tax=Enterococcus villorum TaxID=112904 RepID=UPI003F89A4FA